MGTVVAGLSLSNCRRKFRHTWAGFVSINRSSRRSIGSSPSDLGTACGPGTFVRLASSAKSEWELLEVLKHRRAMCGLPL